MIIAIDYDGTIADTNREKVDWIKSNLGLEIPAFRCNRTDCVPIIGAAAYREMADFVYEHAATLRAEPLPGAIQAVRKLAIDNLLYVVTARAQRRMDFARQWLESKGLIDCIKEIRSSNAMSKMEVCAEINADILIDDDIRHLPQNIRPGLQRILLMAGCKEKLNQSADRSLIKCRSWNEVLIKLKA